MAESLTEKIDVFSKVYLEKEHSEEIPSYREWVMVTHPAENYALKKLLLNEGYEMNRLIGWYSKRTNNGIDLVMDENILDSYEKLFGNRNCLHGNISHLKFNTEEEFKQFNGLCSDLEKLCGQEGRTYWNIGSIKPDLKRIGTTYGTIGIMSGVICGGILSLLFTEPFITYSILTGAGSGLLVGSALFHHKKKKIEYIFQQREELKKEYDGLLKQFKDTYAERISTGKQALEQALLE